MAGKAARRSRVDRKTLRLLDANLNRAREGVRVVEDAARFYWNDGARYRRLRALRHRLDQVARRRYKDLVEARESRNDVGRRLAEGGRQKIEDVVAANVRRAQEAVRVLEEYSKVFSPAAAGEFKAVRYALYQEEKGLLK
jgi:thiamine-phosphate pyrophosphorylase